MTARPPKTRSRHASLPRIAKCTLLAALVFALQGCVYLRLLDVKSQLASFDDYFHSVEGPEGVTLTCKDPTLREDDLLTLGVVPSVKDESSGQLVWEVRMRKRYKDNPSEELDYNLRVYLTFTDGLLSSVRIPQRYTECFSSDFITESIKSLGEAKVSKLKRRIDASFSGTASDYADVTQESVRSTLGHPYELEETEDSVSLSYRYSKMASETEETKKRYTITFTFDRDDGRLLSAETRSIQLEYS